MREKDYTIVKKWDDDFEGSAIYSLVDENGKRYIGQAVDVQRRLHAHRAELSRVFRTQTKESFEGYKLCDYARSGGTFTVEILKKFKWDEVTTNNLNYWEDYYFRQYGGLENTYNSTFPPPVNTWYEPNDYIQVRIKITKEEDRIISEKTDNFSDYIKELIRKDIRENP